MPSRSLPSPATRRRAALALLALVPVALLGGARPSEAQIADLEAIRSAAESAEAANRRLADEGGPAFQPRVLEAIRRSCAARGVTRLDEIRPVKIESDAPSAAAGAALLELDFRGSGPASPAAAAPERRGTDAAVATGGGAATQERGVEAAIEQTGDEAPSKAGQAAVHSPGEAAAPPAASADAPAKLVEGVDRDSVFSAGPRGIELTSGQLRTSRSFAIPRAAIGSIEIDVATSAPGQMLLGWNEAADAPRLRRNNARIELVGDGQLHTYVVDAANALARGLSPGASVRRFFLASRSEAPLRIESLRVLSREQRYASGAVQVTHEECGGELRSVLSLRPPTSVRFEVEVPATQPVFESGFGMVGAADAVVEFEVALEDGDQRTVLRKHLVKSGPWEDVSLDLSRWAGKHVTISLANRGSQGAVALWSSPLLRPRPGDDATEPFVVLLEDALRPDRLSLYGGPVASPSHARVAAGGVVFDRAFAQATQTRSSVPSLMTSLLPSTNGTWDFSDALSDRYVTLAEALRACGFATASFVQNGNAGRYAGLAQGFDVVFDEEKTGARAADLLGPSSPLARWIAAQRGRPWFAYVHVLDPHGPYDPAERPDLSSTKDEPELLRDRSIDAEWLAKPTAAARRLLYDAEVAANDRALGGFLDLLDKNGDLARATVAVVADHGEFLGEHGGLWRHHPPALLEVSRVPFLLKAPGATPGRFAQPVGLFDLMPTLLELAKIDVATLPMQGRSLAASLAGKAPPARAIPSDEMLLDDGVRRARGCGSFATATALWIRSCTRDEDFTPGRLLAERSGEPAALRHVELDPQKLGQETPLGAFGSKLADAAVARSLEAMQQSGIEAWTRMADGAAARIRSDPATTERLRSLGYLQ